MELRPYQNEAKSAVFREWENGCNKTLLVLPTGCGKTIVFAKITEECVRNGQRVLILAHRGELLEQAADKIMKTTGLGCATEKAEESCIGSWYRVVVGSVQTLMREKRLNQFQSDYFDTIIIDEAHHCISDSYRRVLDHFSEAKVLGVTATPDRGDMKNLGQVFESLAYEYTLPKAIKEGYLSPIKALTIPLKLDLTGVGTQAGDFKSSDLSTALDPYLYQIADEMTKHCKNRKTVVFLPLVKTSKKFRDILNEKGFKAAEVNGESKERAEILNDFENNKYNVLCNSMLLTEGWDCPDVDCVVILRPTKVRSLYSQMVGRGTRLAPNKDHLLLLDFLWHTERHELCHPAHLICENEEVAVKMTENIENAGYPVDIEEAEEKAKREAEEKAAAEAEAQRLAEEQAAKEQAEKEAATKASTSTSVAAVAAGSESQSLSNSSGSGDGSNFNTYDNAQQQNTSSSYVLNTSTMKFHRSSCSSVKKIAPQNYSTSNNSREELISQGYSPCGKCNP